MACCVFWLWWYLNTSHPLLVRTRKLTSLGKHFRLAPERVLLGFGSELKKKRIWFVMEHYLVNPFLGYVLVNWTIAAVIYNILTHLSSGDPKSGLIVRGCLSLKKRIEHEWNVTVIYHLLGHLGGPKKRHIFKMAKIPFIQNWPSPATGCVASVFISTITGTKNC